MPKYLDVAAEANVVAKNLMHVIRGESAETQAQVAEMIARLVNLGIRCSPRGVQHTVRLNAVRRAVRDLPVKVSMEERTDERTKRTYNVLVTRLVVNNDVGKGTAETPSDDE